MVDIFNSKKDALNLAKYIVTKCMNDDCPISNIQLQAILFFIQIDIIRRSEGLDLAFFDDFEAWAFGPVIPKVYYYFCGYSGLTILDTFADVTELFASDWYINRIIEQRRSPFNSWEVISEAQNSKAWQQVFADGQGKHMIIPVRLIREMGFAEETEEEGNGTGAGV